MSAIEADRPKAMQTRFCVLEDRGVIKIGGEDAAAFLQGLVTNDVTKVSPGAARYAALLTPQGKILFDFLIALGADGDYLLDCPRQLTADLAKRLAFYRLRAKVRIEDCSRFLRVLALWGGMPEWENVAPESVARFPDPRNAGLGWRMIAPERSEACALSAAIDDYEAHRIGLAVPKGGVDFTYGDTFPHEANFDRLNGLDFHKGCYVGQEVVSRVEHRGLARRRIVSVRFEGEGPPPGTEIKAGDAILGTMGSSVGGRGLAMLRLDRTEAALAAGTPIIAGLTEIMPSLPRNEV